MAACVDVAERRQRTGRRGLAAKRLKKALLFIWKFSGWESNRLTCGSEIGKARNTLMPRENLQLVKLGTSSGVSCYN